jgi:hypothetical protein
MPGVGTDTPVLDAGRGLLFHVTDAPEGGFTARAADEPIFTEADSVEELKDAIRDAVRCHFGENRPAMVTIVQVRHESFAT